MSEKERVIAQGEVPFAVLKGRGTVMARYVTVWYDVGPHSLSDNESTKWTLALDGVEFRVILDVDAHCLRIDDDWARGDQEPMIAKRGLLPYRYSVSYQFWWFHHLGSLSGPVQLKFDTRAMTVTVKTDLKFEAD